MDRSVTDLWILGNRINDEGQGFLPSKAPRGIDVNGAEGYLWTLFPHANYQIQVLSVQNPSDALRTHLTQNGYQMIKQLSWWGETLWALRSIIPSLDLKVLDEIQVPGK